VLVIQRDRAATCPFASPGQRTAALVPGARLPVYRAPRGHFVSHKERLNADLLAFARAALSGPPKTAAHTPFGGCVAAPAPVSCEGDERRSDAGRRA
jgi:hypothetical protein